MIETKTLRDVRDYDPRTLGPQKNEHGYFIAYGWAAAPFGVPSAKWDFDDEGAYNDETDTYDLRRVRVECPACGREQSPLCSPYSRLLVNEWRWVGLDHKEPFATYVTRCRCKSAFKFTTFTPQ